MQLVHLDHLPPQAKLARTIYRFNGTPLLSKGLILQNDAIRKLKYLGIEYLYIFNESNQPHLEIRDIISQQTRQDCNHIVNQAMQTMKDNQILDKKSIEQAVTHILDDLLSQETLLLHLIDIRSNEDYLFAHSVSVCCLSLLMGIALGLNSSELKQLGVGALLHDIGKLFLIGDVPTQLHCEIGYHILRKDPSFSPNCAMTVLQHHKKYGDRSFNEIHLFAQIVGLANFYDNLINPSKGKKYSSHEVYEQIMSACYQAFNPKVATVLLQHIPPYPNGTLVKLNTGEKAVVIAQNIHCLIRPIIRIVKRRDRNTIFNLLENPTLLIQQVLFS